MVTAEFEHVPVDAYQRIADTTACFPPPIALKSCQDRLIEKNLFKSLSIPTTKFAAVSTRAELKAAEAEIGYPMILKRTRFGYDGKGQWRLEDAAQGEEVIQSMPGEQFIAEEFIRFDRELSIIGVFARDGSTAFYPLTETQHINGILDASISPAPNASAELLASASDYVSRVAKELDYTGVLTLELFQVGDGLMANELAPKGS